MTRKKVLIREGRPVAARKPEELSDEERERVVAEEKRLVEYFRDHGRFPDDMTEDQVLMVVTKAATDQIIQPWLDKQKARLFNAVFPMLVEEDMKKLEQQRRAVEGRRGTFKCPRIFEWIVRELEHDPDATNQELATRFPEDDDPYLYRSDDCGRLQGEERQFADDDSGGRLSRHGFDRYVTKARKKLGLSRKSPSRGT